MGKYSCDFIETNFHNIVGRGGMVMLNKNESDEACLFHVHMHKLGLFSVNYQIFMKIGYTIIIVDWLL